MYQNAAILAAFLLIYGAIAGRVERSWLSGPMVFIAVGLVLGPFGLGFVRLNLGAQGLRTLAELTLAMVLFTDAANADFDIVRRNIGIPERLLLIGLPLTIVFGFLVAMVMFPGIAPLEIGAARGVAGADRRGARQTRGDQSDRALGDARGAQHRKRAQRRNLCPDRGAAAGPRGRHPYRARHDNSRRYGGCRRAGDRVRRRPCCDFIDHSPAALCRAPGLDQYALGGSSGRGARGRLFRDSAGDGGSGFIACFVGGLVVSRLRPARKEIWLGGAIATGEALALLTWVAFGVGALAQIVPRLTWASLTYAVLSLTVIRMVPVILCLAGTGMRLADKLFIAWFGPRGLATIVFGIIV